MIIKTTIILIIIIIIRRQKLTLDWCPRKILLAYNMCSLSKMILLFKNVDPFTNEIKSQIVSTCMLLYCMLDYTLLMVMNVSCSIRTHASCPIN